MRISPSAFAWMRNYQPAWLAADGIAGVTLAAYLLPAATGDRIDSGLDDFSARSRTLLLQYRYYVCDVILNRVHAATPPPKLVGLDLSAAPRVDMHSAHTLAAMGTELTAAGIRFQAVEPRSSVRDRLPNEGVDVKLGGINRFRSVADVVEDFQKTALEANNSNDWLLAATAVNRI